MIELSKGLYQAYASGDRLRRDQILKKTMIELLVDNKKELVFKENELFCALKSAENYDGNATGIANWDFLDVFLEERGGIERIIYELEFLGEIS